MLFFMLITSLIASEFVLYTSPPAAFYLLPYRAFELLFGAILALPQIRFPSSERIGTIAALSGFFVIVICLFKINEHTRFPGFNSAIPCLGSILFIWGTSQQNFFISRLSHSSIPNFFGKISYSLYLIHWPMVVLAPKLFAQLGIRYTSYITAYTFIITTVFAGLLYRLVEQPFRTKHEFWTQRRIFKYSAIALIVTFTTSIIIVVNEGFSNRVDKQINQILAVLHYDPKPMFQTKVCFMEPEQETSEYQTATCLPNKHPFVILWGDSHISQYLWGLRPLFQKKEYQIGQVTSSGCAPALNVYVDARPKCRTFNDFALRKIIQLKPEAVILGAAWSGLDEQLQGIKRSISALQTAGIKVIILGPSMVYKDSVPTILANRMKKGNSDISSGDDLESEFIYRKESIMKRFANEQQSVQYISVLDTICPKQTCPMKIGGMPAHFDIVHQTKEGSEYFSDLLFPSIFQTILKNKTVSQNRTDDISL